MARGTFVLVELLPGGGEGERFEWTADDSPPNARGGARAVPLRTWTIGGELKHVRTDYPGARTPSRQILTSVYKPQQFEGRFDDRYNFAGFAAGEMARLENTFRRGNQVRVQFQAQVFTGIVDDWDFPYRRDWDIGYMFRLDVDDRAEDASVRDRSPPTVPTSTQLFDDTDLAVQAALEEHGSVPSSTMAGTLATDTELELQALSDARNALASTLDDRELAPGERPVDAFTRLATQFRAVQAAGATVIAGLFDVRADSDLAVLTPIGVLDFEVWTRGVRFASRIAMISALRGDRAAAERADPNAIRLYQPQEGESLYAISQKFYGTPWAWRLIADRNGLTSFVLSGDELLVIPERGQG